MLLIGWFILSNGHGIISFMFYFVRARPSLFAKALTVSGRIPELLPPSPLEDGPGVEDDRGIRLTPFPFDPSVLFRFLGGIF